jgi:transposase
MRFMIKQQGGVNADVFIEFLKRLIAGASRVIFLIADRGPAPIARETRAFGEGLNGSPRLFYLSPYSPDRNLDALGWKHRKTGPVGRRAVTGKDDFKAEVRSSMRQLQTTRKKSAPSTQSHLSNMPRECSHGYERINNEAWQRNDLRG